MADSVSIAKRSEMMSRIRGRDTIPELQLRRAIWAAGLRYRIHRPVCGSKPDIVFVTARVAVYVDGCFWHGCPLHGVMPKSNTEFWQTKLGRNRERDAQTNLKLRRARWKVLRFWEHEVEKSAAHCANKVIRTVLKRLGRINPTRKK